MAIRKLNNDLITIYRAGDLLNCEKVSMIPTEIDYLIVTENFMSDLATFLSKVKEALPLEFRARVNIEVIQRELALHFYRHAIYPVVNAIINGKVIYGNAPREFSRSNYEVSSLSTHYLICKALYRFNYAEEEFVKGNLRDVARHLFYSVKYSIAALIMGTRKIIVNCWNEMFKIISIDANKLHRVISEWIMGINNKPWRIHRIHKFNYDTLLFIRELDTPYRVIREVWTTLDKENLIDFIGLARIIKSKKPDYIDFVCIDDKPTLIIYNRDKEERISLVND